MTRLHLLLFLVFVSVAPGLAAEDNGTDDDGGVDFGDGWMPGMATGDGGDGSDGDAFDDDDGNSTLCSHLSSDDFSNGCQFWMQGIILCCVGFGGILGNSVSRSIGCEQLLTNLSKNQFDRFFESFWRINDFRRRVFSLFLFS